MSPILRAFALLFVLNASLGSGSEPPPNILLLLSDDHSYPFLSCYGDPNVRTPTLDQLASEGMKCHRFFTSAPQCVPSRAALMTGRSPVACRMTRFSSPLPRDEISLPEILRDQGGYYTGICGRNFHLDGPGKRGQTEAIGKIFDDHQLRTFASRVDFLKTGSDPEVVGQIQDFLDARPVTKPFFLWANFSDPHHVWNAPSQLRPDPESLVLPKHWPDLPGVRQQFADYCAEINRLDETVAGVLSLFRDRDLLDKTLILFLGDNGAALPHGKGSLYDPGSNVPCLVRWPGKIAHGTETRELMSGEDVAPTLLQAAGLGIQKRMSGKSFLPELLGQPHVPREYIFVERGPHGSAPVTVGMTNSGYDLSRSIRSARYKFIYNCTPWIPYSPVDSAGGSAWTQMRELNSLGKLDSALVKTYFQTPRPVYELYDLQQDPSELNNLSGEDSLRKVEATMRRALAEKMVLDCDYLPLPQLFNER